MAHTFLKRISQKVYVIARLGFELVYYDVKVQHVINFIINVLRRVLKFESLASLSNSISSFVGYLMTELSL